MSEAEAVNPKLYRVEIPGVDGSGKQVFEAATQEELVEKLRAAQENATVKIREESQARKIAEEKLQQLESPQEPEQPAASGNQFDKNRYYDLLTKDPDEANAYWFECRFGVSPENLVQDYGQVRQVAQVSLQQQVNAAFVRKHPELLQVSPADDEKNANIIAKILTDNGWGYTVANLEAAYSVAKENGKLLLPKTEEAGTETAPAVIPTVPTTLAGRSTSAGTSAGSTEDEFLRTAPLSEVEAYLRKKQANQFAKP